MSSDRFGLEAGVDRQLEDTEDTRARLRWGPLTKIYRENDTSAFKKRKVIKPDGSIDWIVLRPEFRRLLADLAIGVIDGVIFYDLDRLVRQPRDLEDLIDIVEYAKRPVTGATGGRMNLINDSDRQADRRYTEGEVGDDSGRTKRRTYLPHRQSVKDNVELGCRVLQGAHLVRHSGSVLGGSVGGACAGAGSPLAPFEIPRTVDAAAFTPGVGHLRCTLP
ncbi:recombinase family protein [Streptomyces sp. RPA4-5]|nr:recombinase family protein [Streptomyces sp. RPA4-5]